MQLQVNQNRHTMTFDSQLTVVFSGGLEPTKRQGKAFKFAGQKLPVTAAIVMLPNSSITALTKPKPGDI